MGCGKNCRKENQYRVCNYKREDAGLNRGEKEDSI